jgi:hypothetical protein
MLKDVLDLRDTSHITRMIAFDFLFYYFFYFNILHAR